MGDIGECASPACGVGRGECAGERGDLFGQDDRFGRGRLRNALRERLGGLGPGGGRLRDALLIGVGGSFGLNHGRHVDRRMGVAEVLAVERVFAVVGVVIDFIFVDLRQRRLCSRLLGRAVCRACRGAVPGRLAEGRISIGLRVCGLLGLRLRLLAARGLLELLRVASATGGSHAVALHFLIAQLSDDRRAHHFGDHVEFTVFQALVHDEAHERLAVQGQALRRCGRFKARFGFARERGIEAEETLVVVGVHEHGVERGGEFAAGAHHFLAAHLLFSLLHYLDGRDGGVVHFPRCTLEGIFHFAFEFREESHGRLKPFCGFST